MSYLSSYLSSLRRPAFGLALLTCAGLAAVPGHAQTELDLGKSGTTVSGTATVTDTGTTASGTYTYNDNGTGTPLDQQKAFSALNAFGNSTANVTGGIITGLASYNSSMVNVSGGSISQLATLDFSTVNISGGNVKDIQAYGNGTANISGGSVSFFYTVEGGTIDLFGTGFTETFEGYPQGSILQYKVRGTLQDGTALDATYDYFGGNLIFSSPVPEASSVISLGILLVLGLSGLAVRARRKAQAAG